MIADFENCNGNFWLNIVLDMWYVHLLFCYKCKLLKLERLMRMSRAGLPGDPRLCCLEPRSPVSAGAKIFQLRTCTFYSTAHIYTVPTSFPLPIEYGIFGAGSQISTNQRRESTVSSLLIGLDLRPFPDNTELHKYFLNVFF